MTLPPARTPGIRPLTWAMWIVAVSPLLLLTGTAASDYAGYFRAILDAALAQARSGSTSTSLPPGAVAPFATLLIGGLLAFLSQVAFVVFAGVDWLLLRRRGVDRPFHWAWSFFVLITFGGLVHPIGRTVVAQRRTGRSAWVPLVVFIVLTVAGYAAVIVKIVEVVTVLERFAVQVQDLT